MDTEGQLRDLYRAFNSRDIDAVLGAMTDDVDWPNAWEGGRLRGHDAVRDYWSRQWAEIDPRVDPEEMVRLPDGRISVTVHQVVRSPDGQLLSDGRVAHVYELRDGRIAGMTVEELG